MTTKNILDEKLDTIRVQIQLQELLGIEGYGIVCELWSEQRRQLDQLAALLIEIFLAEEDAKNR